MKNLFFNENAELNDNIHSKFCGHLGKYAITNKYIFDIKNIEVIKYNTNNYDKYDNILIVESKIKNWSNLRRLMI